MTDPQLEMHRALYLAAMIGMCAALVVYVVLM